MLKFYSYCTRMVNTARGVEECLESAVGNNTSNINLLIYHCSVGHDFQELLETSKKEVPHAQVVAVSCGGVVGKEGVSESLKDIALMAVEGSEFAVSHCDDLSGFNAYDKCFEMASELRQKDSGINMIYYLGSGIDTANDQCIRAIEAVFGADITIFGATTADNMKGIVNYQAVNNKVMEHGAVLIGFSDPTIKVSTRATHGFEVIGESLVVTKANGHIIQEFNGKPAWSEYLNRMGLPASSTCGDTIPIGALGERISDSDAAEYGNEYVLRVVTQHNGQGMYYSTLIEEGTELYLTTRNEDLIFKEMDRIVHKLVDSLNGGTPVAVFHADCLARGRSLFNRIIKEELVERMQHPLHVNGECPAWLGMYGFGEFARLGDRNEYHNYTTALYVLYR